MLHLRTLTPACLSVAVLTACSSSNIPVSSPSLADPHGSRAFHYKSDAQTFTVPPRVTHVTVTAYGASGGSFPSSSKPAVAFGAAVNATIAVKPGQSLMVYVGGKGNGQAGGFNGGGAGGHGGNGGGGSSDVRTGKGDLAERIIVAAGGGGSGDTGFLYDSGSYICPGGAGGKGGATVGGDGGYGGCIAGGGGAGGSARAGGAGGAAGPLGGSSLPGSNTPCRGGPGAPGNLLDGGTGASVCAGAGGGGGGGYYGGGGGGSGGCCADPTGYGAGGGGGGGSSFVEKSATNVHEVKGGAPRGNGEVKFSW
jgi:hypothetical protein